ncbi:MAG: PA2169 family four-helix-bundle protein [Cellvibrionaceae bacterium]|nr:PA2169 family four-helix-bundle protein [Cellvibrionaceae bacterium]
MTMQTYNRSDDVKCLNLFLKNELSAVETYQQCIKKLDDEKIASGLADLQNSHQRRVQLLRQKIAELGGDPVDSSGLWGSFAKMVEGSATVFGDKSAIAALEEGEDRGRDNYIDKSDDLSPEVQRFVNAELLPEQRRSHDMLNRIQQMVH